MPTAAGSWAGLMVAMLAKPPRAVASPAPSRAVSQGLWVAGHPGHRPWRRTGAVWRDLAEGTRDMLSPLPGVVALAALASGCCSPDAVTGVTYCFVGVGTADPGVPLPWLCSGCSYTAPLRWAVRVRL